MRCRENRSYGDFDACFLHALAKLIICAADCVLTFHVSSPYRLENARRLFDCVSFTVYRSSYYHTVLNADGRVHTVTCLCLFYLFPYTIFYTFLQLCIPFYSLLVLFLYSHLYAHFFHRPQLYSSARFIRRDYLLVCFGFHPSQPCTASSFLPLIYLLTPPVYLSCLFCPV